MSTGSERWKFKTAVIKGFHDKLLNVGFEYKMHYKTLTAYWKPVCLYWEVD